MGRGKNRGANRFTGSQRKIEARTVTTGDEQPKACSGPSKKTNLEAGAHEVTFAGCWPSYVNPLYENISHWYSVFFCAYVTFVVFAVMRVITAIFIKETLDAAGEDHEVVMSEKEATKQKYMRKLERVFHEVDTSGDGLISEDEFRSMMEDPNVKRFLAGLEVDLNESHSLFHMLADEEGQVSYSKFMEGMIRAHGPAKSADVLCIRQDLEFIRKDLKQIKAAAHGEQECGPPSRAASNRLNGRY
ncbi:hypothetical protein AK812_SmicGene41631 [Symbiodinium microadriaticum]|uniref:EF-hand domain-containing protein n=1 Tax=Symbiodinium microadriaticum TaxID=2951 RepID=A0A1Q9C5P2_SYMMI|nr:hypothetical protein AK812_SmicGene41631 [Symbiodinium microadriaticum]